MRDDLERELDLVLNLDRSASNRNPLNHGNASAEYEDLAGWQVIISAEKEGCAAFQKVRPSNPRDPRLVRPDIGSADFYLVDEEDGSIEQTAGEERGRQ